MNEPLPPPGSDHDGESGSLADQPPLEVIGQFAGSIAHDFNNILGVIINYARFASGAIAQGSPALADIEEIQRAADRGVALARQMMILARGAPGSEAVFNVNEVIGGLDGYLRSAVGSHVEIERRLEPDLWPIAEAPDRIEQVLINLAANARDAMPDGGTLCFETGNAEFHEADAALHPGIAPGRFIRLSVSDTGVGMADDVARQAFDPMFTTKVSGEGTGLGLATVHTIVSLAGGTLGLETAPGQGTTVEIHLPATELGPAQTTTPPRAVSAGRGEAVLIAEDDPAVRRVAERILGNAGYEIRSAGGGSEALAMLAGSAGSATVDLLLADVVMPGMRGDELARRALEVRPGLNVLFMSGYSDRPPPSDLGPTAGSVAFIDKPFDAGTLLEQVRRLLEPTPSGA